MAAIHRRLPDSVALGGTLEVSDETPTGGELMHVRVGKYKGNPVAATTRTVPPKNNLDWIRQVGSTWFSSRKVDREALF
jgi:hypothetical protein